MTDDRADEVAALLRSAGHAHHQAFIETDGDDPEWPLWYAGYLAEPLNAFLGTAFTQSEIVFHLLTAVRRHEAEEPDVPWAASYARYFLAAA